MPRSLRTFHVTFTNQAQDEAEGPEVVAEQSNIQAQSLWHLMRVLCSDFREELDTCDGLEVGLESLS